jgi:hypothetical protein
MKKYAFTILFGMILFNGFAARADDTNATGVTKQDVPNEQKTIQWLQDHLQQFGIDPNPNHLTLGEYLRQSYIHGFEINSITIQSNVINFRTVENYQYTYENDRTSYINSSVAFQLSDLYTPPEVLHGVTDQSGKAYTVVRLLSFTNDVVISSKDLEIWDGDDGKFYGWYNGRKIMDIDPAKIIPVNRTATTRDEAADWQRRDESRAAAI